jgi:hypothetical protein
MFCVHQFVLIMFEINQNDVELVYECLNNVHFLLTIRRIFVTIYERVRLNVLIQVILDL